MKLVGPLRVYPGGLAVSRSIGDVLLKAKVPGAIVATPDVVQVVLADDAFALLLARCAHTLRALGQSTAQQAHARGVHTAMQREIFSKKGGRRSASIFGVA